MASSSSSSSSSSSILPSFLCDKELGKLLREWHVKPATPTSTSTSRTTPIPNDLYQRLEKVVDGFPMLRVRDTDEEESVAHLRGVMEGLIKQAMENDPNNSAKYQKLIPKINPPPLPQQQQLQQHEVDNDIGLSIADYEARYADKLDDKDRVCLTLFSMLPEGFVVNKTEVFYLSLGLGIHDHYSENYLKDDSKLAKLVEEGFLTRINTSNSNCFSNSYMMQNSVLSWAQQKNAIRLSTTYAEHGFHMLGDMFSNMLVININNKFLNSDTAFNLILGKVGYKRPIVLHLGTWRGKRQSADHSNNYSRDDYIVVDQESLHKAFLSHERMLFSSRSSVHIRCLSSVLPCIGSVPLPNLACCFCNLFFTHSILSLYYKIVILSLRGTSGIVHLPHSVSKLTDLYFLDLSECNNLESLPRGIGSLTSLRYLDLSECYLLEYIPKDITSLRSLKVLKGFIINLDPHVLSRSNRRKWCNKLTAPTSSSSSCPFSELCHLIRLEKLTIRTTRMNFPTNDDLHTLCSLQRLSILGITWVGNPNRAQIDGNLQEFPNTVKKLVLQSAPLQTKSQLLELIGKQKQDSRLNKLYIRGGWFREFSPEKHCFPTVMIVRLRYLPNLEGQWDQFRVLFPNLTCLEIFQCPKLNSFPCGSSGIWKK